MTCGANDAGDMLGQEACAAAEVQHALALGNGKRLDQALARLELPADADLLVVPRQRLAVVCEGRSGRSARRHGVRCERCQSQSANSTTSDPIKAETTSRSEIDTRSSCSSSPKMRKTKPPTN